MYILSLKTLSMSHVLYVSGSFVNSSPVLMEIELKRWHVHRPLPKCPKLSGSIVIFVQRLVHIDIMISGCLRKQYG